MISLQQVTERVLKLFLFHQRTALFMETHGQNERLVDRWTNILTVNLLSISADYGANPESKPFSHCVEPSEGFPSGQQFPEMVRCLDPHCHLYNQSMRLISAF